MLAGARRPARSPPAHAVNGPARGLPEVVGEARAERRDVLDDVRVPLNLARAGRVTEQVRIVALLPDKDEVGSCHELCDVRAPRRGAGKGAGRDTPPAFVLCFVLAPELVLLDELLVREDDPTRYRVSPLHRRKGSDARR